LILSPTFQYVPTTTTTTIIIIIIIIIIKSQKFDNTKTARGHIQNFAKGSSAWSSQYFPHISNDTGKLYKHI